MGFARWIGEHVFSLLYVVHMLLFVSVVLREREQPDSALAWGLLVNLLPGLGPLLYVVFGHSSGMRCVRKRKRFAVEEGLQRELRAALSRVQTPVDSPCETARLIRAQNDSPCTEGNALEILVDAQAKYPRLFADLRAAKESIHALYFIIEKDETGQRFVDILAQKAREGVAVRVLYDRMASLRAGKRFFRPITEAGGVVRPYLPTLRENLLRINHRNHRKLVVVDGRIGYTGGINIGDEYLGSKPKTAPWHDTQLRAVGPIVAAMQQRFWLDWAFAHGKVPGEVTFPAPETGGKACAQFVTSSPERPKEEIKFAYMKLIGEARVSLDVQSPYFAPDEPFLQALYLASATGVDVRVMLPGKPDKRYVYWITLSHVEGLLRRGIRVFLHPGFLHAKMLVADRAVVSIGTANIDTRSFMLDFEDCVFAYDAPFAETCSRVFEADRELCTELRLESFRRRPLMQKCVEAAFRLLRPLV